jgi:hypothetical protein
LNKLDKLNKFGDMGTLEMAEELMSKSQNEEIFEKSKD